MDGTISQLVIFLAATFAASFVAGVSGFAFALIAAAVWLHVLTPIQTVTLTVSYGLLVQGYGAWRMRHAASWRLIWPFLLGGAFGVAIGALALQWANPSHLRSGIGVFLVLYALYGLLRPAIRVARGGRLADTGIGFLSGVLGAMTGFAGILIVIWSGLRGWPRDVQRGVFQPASVALLLMCALAFGVTGSIARDTIALFAIGLPALIAGTWAGFLLYGRLDEATFRRIVLILLLVSGVPLILRQVLGA
jgi:uncharacterized membrane protein YfcA